MTGLLTFTEADNYGALLQAYALQTTLNTLGYEAVFLNLKQTQMPPEKDLSALPSLLRQKIEETIYHYTVRSEKFQKFRKQYLHITDFVPPQAINSLNDQFDRFIVGSDQVWNFNITGGDMNYTLPFAEEDKRFSYAASFGGAEGLNRATENFWKELSHFKKISLRENDGAEKCRNKTGIAPTVDVDPCFLLSEWEWERLIKNEDESYEKYVLLFLIEYDAAFYAKAKEFADMKKLPLYIITASYMPHFGFEAYSGTGVTTWIKRIHDAEYVFCDSFHGCVFSILFRKNFMPNFSKAKLAGRSSRLDNLLKGLGLKSEAMNENIDYTLVKNKIDAEKNKSISYLKEIHE